jgi:hypothetical protein
VKRLTAVVSIVAAVVLGQASALAAYTRATSAPLHVTEIYSNEWGSPFVYVSAAVNAACAGGNGLYLYDITANPPNLEFRKNKMAVLLTAKAMDKTVVLDYFYDAGAGGWNGCYIQGISIVD